MIKFLFLIFIVYFSINGYCNSLDSNLIIEARLSKTKFKIFEPIVVEVKIINIGKVIDSVEKDINFYLEANVTNDKGQYFEYRYGVHDGLRGISIPHYVLKPHDTLIHIFSFSEYQINKDSNFFGPYFPFGKYKVVMDSREPPYLKSITFNFEVIDLELEDSAVLSLFKEKQFKLITDNYPLNDFAEFARLEILKQKLQETYIDSKEKEELQYLFEDFINSFPDSFYAIYYVSQYLNFLYHNDYNDVEKEIKYLFKKINPSTAAFSYFNNKLMQTIIINSIKKNNYRIEQD